MAAQPCLYTPVLPKTRSSPNPSYVRYPTKNMEVVYPQLWIFDFNRRTWTCVEAAGGGGASGGGKSKGNNNSSAAAGPDPPAVFDHTATLAGGTHIVVIGGVMVGRALNSQVRGSIRVLLAAGRALCVQNTRWAAFVFVWLRRLRFWSESRRATLAPNENEFASVPSCVSFCIRISTTTTTRHQQLQLLQNLHRQAFLQDFRPGWCGVLPVTTQHPSQSRRAAVSLDVVL